MADFYADELHEELRSGGAKTRGKHATTEFRQKRGFDKPGSKGGMRGMRKPRGRSRPTPCRAAVVSAATEKIRE
ncbi:MAG: hypothetical protein MUF86_01445 [Akkermansiaceae bacterium]|nr:hypothetical protein [Akkermansiaceae bacterium]